MMTLKNLISFLAVRFKSPRIFYYREEQLTFERRREQIQSSTYFSCRHLRD